MDPTWLLLLISAAVPALITVLGPHLSARLKARQLTRKTDIDIAADVRDAIYAELERVQGELRAARVRISTLERRVSGQDTWILRLERIVRERVPDEWTGLDGLRPDIIDEEEAG